MGCDSAKKAKKVMDVEKECGSGRDQNFAPVRARGSAMHCGARGHLECAEEGSMHATGTIRGDAENMEAAWQKACSES